MPRLWQDPRVLITPHVFGAGAGDRHRAIDVSCEDLRAYRDGTPLTNVVDGERGG